MKNCGIPAGPMLRLYGYWLSRKGRARAPRRQDVDLDDIPRIIPCVAPALNVIDVEMNPLRFRHRIVGPDLIEKLGRDVTGKYVGQETYGAAAAEIISSLAVIVNECLPYHRQARLDWNGQGWLMMDSVELPLIDGNGRVDTILRAAKFSPIELPLRDRLQFRPILQPEMPPET